MANHFEYSELTCANYSQAITSVRRIYEDTYKLSFKLPETFVESDKIMQMLSTKYQKSTLINFVSAILWSLNKLDRKSYTESYISEISAKYRAHSSEIKSQIERDKIGKEFQLTEKEQKSFIRWEDILKMYATISKNVSKSNYNTFMDFVIVSLYILHPPVRADYANMKFFIEDSFVPVNESENYCVLQTNPRFVFNKYKTAKHNGTTVIHIEPELHEILLDWAEINTSNYLLSSYVQSKNEFKPFSENTLSKRITSIFTKYANVPATINTLRHSFVSFMSKNDQEYSLKQNNAAKMMHSISMADKYRRMVYLE